MGQNKSQSIFVSSPVGLHHGPICHNNIHLFLQQSRIYHNNSGIFHMRKYVFLLLEESKYRFPFWFWKYFSKYLVLTNASYVKLHEIGCSCWQWIKIKAANIDADLCTGLCWHHGCLYFPLKLAWISLSNIHFAT